MLVIVSRDKFGWGEKEDGPRANFFSHAVAALPHWMQDFESAWRVKPAKQSHSVSDYQSELHPQGMMPENAKEDVDNIGLHTTQRHAVGVMKKSRFNPAAIKPAESGNIAFEDGHGHMNVSAHAATQAGRCLRR